LCAAAAHAGTPAQRQVLKSASTHHSDEQSKAARRRCARLSATIIVSRDRRPTDRQMEILTHIRETLKTGEGGSISVEGCVVT
jgi:hypothetical protein